MSADALAGATRDAGATVARTPSRPRFRAAGRSRRRHGSRRERSLALVLVAAGCAGAPLPRPRALPEPRTELEAATREIYTAIPIGDRAVWERWLAPDFVLLDRDGKRVDRKAVLDDFKPLPPTITVDLAIADLQVLSLGADAGVVSFVVHETETIWGQTLKVDYQTSLTFARRAGRWQLVIFQYVEIPRDAEPIDVDPARLAEYVGEYAADATTKYVVTLDGGVLHGARAGKPAVELVPEADGVFYEPGSEFRKIFVRDAEGRVVEMRDRRKGTDVRWRRV